jgi:hypothetical protein
MSNFIAGGYTATYNAKAIGQAAQGYRISQQFFQRLVTGDSMAESPQDAVYRGMEMHVAMNLIEYGAAGIQDIMCPYATQWAMGQVGRMDITSSLAKSLILTAVAGTPAAATPATATFLTSILAEGFPVELLFAPDLREVPMRLRVYPNAAGVFGTKT